MFWFIVFGLGFFWAYKARQANTFIKENPNHPMAFKMFAVSGLFYAMATITIGLFPMMLKGYTDNLIPSLVVLVPAILIGLAAWAEYKGDMQLANNWVQRSFYAVVIGVVIMSFAVPTEDYNFPEQTQEQQGNELDPDAYVAPPQ